MSPSNLNLPLELLSLVADNLEPCAKSLSSLARTNRVLNTSITPRLYADKTRAAHAVKWAALTGREGALKKAVAFARQKGGSAAVKRLMSRASRVSPRGPPLVDAVREDNARIVEFLLQTEGVDPMCKQVHKFYDGAPLSCAARHGSADAMRVLLADGRVDPNDRDRRGHDALFHALEANPGSREVVGLLVSDRRVELNLQYPHGPTPLSLVARKRNPDFVRLFLKEDRVDIEILDGLGFTPLMNAVKVGFLEMAELLLERGAQPSARSSHGFTALVIAASCSHVDIFRLLLAQPGIEQDPCGSDGRTPHLLQIAISCHPGILKALLEADVFNVNARDRATGNTALHWAANGGVSEALRLLLASEKVDTNARNHDGQTPLMLAVRSKDRDVVRELLAKRDDVDVNLRDCQGKTALMLAALLRDPGMVEQLLADANSGRRTPLDLGCKDLVGKTALSIAAGIAGSTSVAKVILPACPADIVESPDFYGETPLTLAVEAGRGGLVNSLLARDDVDLDVNTKDDNGRTVLSVALMRNPTATVIKNLLARPDLDVNSKDEDGKTALALAVERVDWKTPFIRQLVAHDGIDLNPTDNDGQTPYLWAVLNDRKRVARFLKGTKGVKTDIDKLMRTVRRCRRENVRCAGAEKDAASRLQRRG